MQVPEKSLLSRLFFNPGKFLSSEVEGIENLNTWRHSSDGKSLAYIEVTIRARRIQENIVALVSPATS